MKTSRWLTAFWLLVLLLPLLVLGIERRERRSLELASARSAARTRARELMFESQATVLPKDGITLVLRRFQERAGRIALAAGSDLPLKRRRLARLYREQVEPWLPEHAVSWRWLPDLEAPSGLRFDAARGRRFPRHLPDRLLAWRTGRYDNRDEIGRLMSEIIGSPVNLKSQASTKSGKLQSYLNPDGVRGLYWRVQPQSGIVAWLDLTDLDPFLGIRIAAAQVENPGCGLLYTDNRGNPVFGGGEWRAGGRRLAERLLLLGGERFPALAVVGKRLVMTALPPSGMTGRIIVSVPWPVQDGFGAVSASGTPVWAAVLGILALIGLTGVAAFVSRRATVGWMLLGACLGLAIVPAGAGWMLVKRSVAEYGRAELRTRTTNLHRELTSLDNGCMALHATMIGRLLALARVPSTIEALEGRTAAALRDTLRSLLFQGGVPDIYPELGGPEILLSVAPDDRTNIITRRMSDADSITSAERPILDAFGPLAKKMRDGIMRIGKDDAPWEGLSEANRIRSTMTSDILFDLYVGIFGIDAMISQITFPEELIEVQTSFMRIFVLGLRIFRGLSMPTEWLLLWIWDDSREMAYVRRIFNERFPAKISPAAMPVITPGSESPDAEPAAPEIWMLTGLAEHMFSGLVMPQNVNAPPTLLGAIERARNTGSTQAGRDMSAPGRPIFEAFIGNKLSRFVIGGQVETNSIERNVRRMQVAGNILAIGLVVAALGLAWHGRRRLLEPLERLRLAMTRVAEGCFSERLPVDRSDEFGTLAVAFNSMARALEEAAILGRFVSGSVRRAVRDRRTDERGRGERREVTVLFSCLFRFDRLCAEKDTMQVFDALGAHLGALNTELQPFATGAEIDKVIGDKILVVFDHERLGGKNEAAAAVISVVSGVRRRMQAAGLESAMGINAGQVISGILGAASVRLDHTVIGDPVNLASRLALLAHMAEGTRTVMSGAFLDTCALRPKAEKLPFKRVKGKTQEVEAWLLLDDV